MGARRGTRGGVGTNQYQVVGGGADYDESVVAGIRSLADRAPTHPSSSALAGDHLTERPTAILVADTSKAIDESVDAVLRGNGRNGGEVIRSATKLAAHEDAIYRKHPTMYGHALIEATYFAKEASTSPEIANRIARDPDGPLADRARAYAALLGDASGTPEHELGVDELTGVLARISRVDSEWTSSDADRHDPHTTTGGTPPLSIRHAALSVAFSRSSGEEAERLRNELTATQAELNRRRIEEIDF